MGLISNAILIPLMPTIAKNASSEDKKDPQNPQGSRIRLLEELLEPVTNTINTILLSCEFHKPKSSETYPVPDKIDRTLNEEILKLSKKDNSLLFKNKYKNITKTDTINK